MNFNSLPYLLFLPLVCLIHWRLPHRVRWLWLLGGSWLFYFWWEPRAGLLLVGTTLVTWLCARAISREKRPGIRHLWCAAALAAALGVLGIFKYAGFFASILGLDLGLRILLPVGISFYTFQTLSYVLDVYRGRIPPEDHFGYYALFVTFFPQLVAGPIERPEHLLPQLRGERTWDSRNLREGGWLLLTGYFKKVVIADGLAPLVDRVYAAPETAAGPAVILATALFGLQILCDFSGYTDIARGSARLLGIELMENFKRPYAAESIREFWRRWHISLTSWFTDYVYIPLGGSRRGLPRRIFNVLIVFLLSGLWHGAGWTFVVWGGIHGLYMALELLLDRGKIPRAGTLSCFLRRVRTFALLSFAWLFFRAETLRDAAVLLSRLPRGWGASPLSLTEALGAGLLILCLALLERLGTEADSMPRRIPPMTVFYLILTISVGWLCLLSAGGQNAFIYFQF